MQGLSEFGEGDAFQFLVLSHGLDRLGDVLGLQHAHVPGRLVPRVLGKKEETD